MYRRPQRPASPQPAAAKRGEKRRAEEESRRGVKRGTEEKIKHRQTTIIVLAKGKMLTGGIVTDGRRAAGATANGALPVREMANDDVVNGQTTKGCATCPPAWENFTSAS